MLYDCNILERQKNQGNSKMTSDYKGLGGGRKDE